jgi:Polyketide cyclase / dehydrase and lipid transport
VSAGLSDFGSIKATEPITSFEAKRTGVGIVRTIGRGDGKVMERLNRHSAKAMVCSYSITNDDCPLPVMGYSATVMVADEGNGTCNVNWSGTFEPKGDVAAASKVVEGTYKGGIAGARRALGRGS